MATVNYADALAGSGDDEEVKPSPGTHDVEVTKVEIKQTKNGDDYFSVAVKITAGAFANKPLWFNVFPTFKNFRWIAPGLGVNPKNVDASTTSEDIVRMMEGTRSRVTWTYQKDSTFTELKATEFLSRGDSTPPGLPVTPQASGAAPIPSFTPPQSLTSAPVPQAPQSELSAEETF